MLSARDYAEKWSRNLQGATQTITQGVQAVTTSPMEKAAANLDKAVQNYAESVSSGRMANALRSKSLEDWRKAFLTKGITRIAQGATQGKADVEKFLTQWLPVMQQVKDQVAQMPSGTIEDGLARVRKVMEAGKRFAGKTY